MRAALVVVVVAVVVVLVVLVVDIGRGRQSVQGTMRTSGAHA